LDEEGKPVIQQETGGEPRKVDAEELRRMSAFTDFIENLNMDDVEKSGESAP
jgi:hypothetical protein